ncbi:MAG: hypothetical protein UIJ87_05075 [Anaerovoracaceae bacterium]|nr:hypothetical protein [Anaerovoracaceae bacterium]
MKWTKKVHAKQLKEKYISAALAAVRTDPKGLTEGKGDGIDFKDRSRVSAKGGCAFRMYPLLPLPTEVFSFSGKVSIKAFLRR